MNAIENLQNWLDNNPHFSGGVPRILAEDMLAEYQALSLKYDEAKRLNNRAVCVYCGTFIEHNGDFSKIGEHVLTCEKRPEFKLIPIIVELGQLIASRRMTPYNGDVYEAHLNKLDELLTQFEKDNTHA